MAHRFYVPGGISEGRVRFEPYQEKQIRSVLRLHEGDTVRVFDKSGREFTARLAAPGIAEIESEFPPAVEPELGLTLVQALPKGDKIEMILQKCTEIGVSRFMLMETERSVARIPEERLARRMERWRMIVREAAEQSGRARVPEVEGIYTLRDALAASPEARIIAWEEEAAPLHAVSGEAGLFIGPEGGFTEEEVALARELGATSVSLGPRILRTETAAMVASALLIYR
ncbi:MAG: RsmE family RNA methyltransferase [Armatimonadota bacterium]